jgi:MoaA/NifB/PqqE/SkfB family radical SAM enzyme
MAEVSKSGSTLFDGRVPFPEFASIETTMKCNLQCPMCLPYLEGTTVLGSHMELDDFEHVAKALFPYVDRFQLTVSGEPLMSKGLGRMLQLAEEYGVRAEYYTNGTLLNDRMIALILPTLGEICVSFDGATKETFEVLRAGATFEHVVRNVERLAAALRKIPKERRPIAGFAVTVMEKNVRELPAIVELAHRLELDFVTIAHVFPVVADMQRQSLAHHAALANEWIDRALARGRELGVPVNVQPLDQVIAAMADAARPSGTSERALAHDDGVVAGLEGRAVNEDLRRMPPAARATTAAASDRVASRPRLRSRPGDLAAPASREPMPEEVWFCDFLWNRIYVTAEGVVRPCCVPGVPDIGDFRQSDLAGIWDNDAYRAMRIGLVRRDPAPVCKGCQHIRRIADPAEIDRVLGGRALPQPEPLPMVLKPVIEGESVAVYGTPGQPVLSSDPPVFEWPAMEGNAGYEFVGSATAGTRRMLYDTARRGIEVPEPRLPIPTWVWSEAPAGVLIEWRAIARMPRARVVVARGCLMRSG